MEFLCQPGMMISCGDSKCLILSAWAVDGLLVDTQFGALSVGLWRDVRVLVQRVSTKSTRKSLCGTCISSSLPNRSEVSKGSVTGAQM